MNGTVIWINEMQKSINVTVKKKERKEKKSHILDDTKKKSWAMLRDPIQSRRGTKESATKDWKAPRQRGYLIHF